MSGGTAGDPPRPLHSVLVAAPGANFADAGELLLVGDHPTLRARVPARHAPNSLNEIAPDLARLLEHLRTPVLTIDAVATAAALSAAGVRALDLIDGTLAIRLASQGDEPTQHLQTASTAHGLRSLDPHEAAALALHAMWPSLQRRLDADGQWDALGHESAAACALGRVQHAGVPFDVPAFERLAAQWRAQSSQLPADDPRQARLGKLVSTYAHWGLEYVESDGRIRARWHAHAAQSGRMACRDPNLQQLPTEHTAPGFRACVRASPQHVLISADYGQIELRVAATIAGCEALLRVFREGGDPHLRTASELAGVAESAVTPHQRKLAKAVNFGFLFGMGPKRFADYARDSYGLELDAQQARAAKDAFLRAYPGIAAWHHRVAALSEALPFVIRTGGGRRVRVGADGHFSYSNALNLPVQGTAADGFKRALTLLDRRLPAHGAEVILCVHDEFVVHCPSAHAARVRDLVTEAMIEGMQQVVPEVPIVVDAQVSPHWGEASP